jgi:hypothetical protein
MGQVIVKSYDTETLVDNIRRSYPGDTDMLRECKKLELSLCDDGWRGNVEKLMSTNTVDIEDDIQSFKQGIGLESVSMLESTSTVESGSKVLNDGSVSSTGTSRK